MPNWEQIRKEWETTKKTYRELEEQFDVKQSTIRSRKNREKWQRNKSNDATQQKRSVATKKSASIASDEKRTTSNAQKNRSGNPNPKNQFTKRNSAAVTHGLFAKYLPRETQEIVDGLVSINPIDILWENIKIQVASILRAQQIMHVESKDEMIKELKKEKSDEFGDERTYEFQFAWDRQATFMNAQSRAMSELRNMIKQYDELLRTDLATEEQKTRIELLKSKVPNQDTANMNDQIVALADLINNPADDRVIDDE